MNPGRNFVARERRIEPPALIGVEHRAPSTGRKGLPAVDRAPELSRHGAVPDLLEAVLLEVPELVVLLACPGCYTAYVHPAVDREVVQIGPRLMAMDPHRPAADRSSDP